MINVRELRKIYPINKKSLVALNQVSFAIQEGETLGLVGESGCGKSTIGRLLLRLEDPTSGIIEYKGENILELSSKAFKPLRRELQMIFQDPYASLNPRMTAEAIIAEPLKIHRIPNVRECVQEILELVGLNPAYAQRYPHEFSGGQRQRIGIARALVMRPRFVVCDEPISSLDVSVRAQIVNLLKTLQQNLGLTYLFIAHDLGIVKVLSDHIAVMYLGNIVEMAPTASLFATPLHPYTQALLSAIPIPDPQIERKRSRIVLTGDVPSPLHIPKGCIFASRCPKAMPICHQIAPKTTLHNANHSVSCHLYP